MRAVPWCPGVNGRNATPRRKKQLSLRSRGAHAIRVLIGHPGIRYLVVGGVCFSVDLGLLATFTEILYWPLWIATGTAFLFSFFFTFALQRTISFKSDTPHGWSLAKYAILVAVNTLATISIVALLSKYPGGWVAGKIVATIVTTGWNYFIYRYWVFAQKKLELN